ncbi:uncharacterized protein N7500_000608 [Penicillium coprophilum]|uniref:uncharacterized protein n=1 Tax=Penicillium coprophilum TaxID=36646 RepID=UPI00238BEE73|nr:uncharacterized protein N7500_000608 [Penicillium coprophilum]KAJ5177909.1 hypothetical protein N7500_000608 [Penicillium coprophilum]
MSSITSLTMAGFTASGQLADWSATSSITTPITTSTIFSIASLTMAGFIASGQLADWLNIHLNHHFGDVFDYHSNYPLRSPLRSTTTNLTVAGFAAPAKSAQLTDL